MPSLSYQRLVELSHPIHPDIPRWPGDPPVQFSQAASIETDGYYLRSFAMGEHSATHVNAPLSFFPGAPGIDTIPLETLLRPAVVINARSQAADRPDFALAAQDILVWEERHGKVPAGCLALLCTGWGAYWDDPQRFLGLDAAGQAHFPGFSPDAARFLLDERQVSGLGSDTHGLEAGLDTGFHVNRLALAAGALVMENLANLEQLPPTGSVVIVGVLRLVGGSGSPAAVFAFIP